MNTKTDESISSAKVDSKLDIISPLDGTVLSQIEIGRAASVKIAVEKAEHAFKTWALTPIRERAQFLARFKEKVEQNMGEMAQLISQENGKTTGEAGDEIKRGLEVVEFATSIPN